MTEPLTTWTLYDHPADFPDGFVARKFIGDQPTDEFVVAGSLDDIRRLVRNLAEPGAVCFPRDPTDDPAIIETWI